MGGQRSASGGLRQVVLGFLAALISISVVCGSLLLAFSEDELRQALVKSATLVFTPSPASVLTSMPTQTPGGPIQVEATPTPTTTATSSQGIATCLPPAGWVALSVQPDDTLESLALLYGVELQALKEANCLLTNRLSIGLLIYVPAPPDEPDTATPEPSLTPIPCGPPRGWVAYTIRSGDTIYSLALATGTTVREIQFANCLASPDHIRVGQVIYLPKAPPASTPTRIPTATKPASTVPAPKLSLSKSASPSTYSTVGSVISYSFVLTNTGNVALNGPFSVSDDKTSNESCPSTASLAPGASITCSASYSITQADLDAGSVTNTATASSSTVSSNADSETVTAQQNRALSIAKSASPSTYNAAGNVISYTFLVTNTGNVSLSGPFSVSDDKAGNESCPSTATLAPGAAITCSASYTITNADISAGSVTNTATASNSAVTSPSDSETVTYAPSADLVVTMTDSPDPVTAGAALTYTLAVTNNGPSTATNVAVTGSIPAGTTFVSVSGSGWACGNSSGNVTCTRSSLEVGAAPAITISVTAPADPGQISYTASVTSVTPDPAPANNSFTESTTVAASSVSLINGTLICQVFSSGAHHAWSGKRGNILHSSIVFVSAMISLEGYHRVGILKVFYEQQRDESL